MVTKNCFSIILNWSIDKSESSEFFYPLDNSSKFYIFASPNHSLPALDDNFMVIILKRYSPFKNDIQVLSTISILNKDGRKVRTQVSKMFFIKNKYEPEDGGVYFITRDFLNKSGLIVDGKIKIHCEVEIINDKNDFNVAILSNLKIENTSEKALEDYQSLLDDPKHSDVVFVVGGKQFKLHKNILSARSKVFAAMFNSDLKENKQNRVEIIDVDVEAFEKLLCFIYTGKLPSTDQYTIELFVASDKYQFETIKEMCELSLCENLSIDSLSSVLTLADMHSASKLKSKCIEFFTKNATKVMQTEGWKEMIKTKGHLVLELLKEIASKAEPYLK